MGLPPWVIDAASANVVETSIVPVLLLVGGGVKWLVDSRRSARAALRGERRAGDAADDDRADRAYTALIERQGAEIGRLTTELEAARCEIRALRDRIESLIPHLPVMVTATAKATA